MAAGVTDRTWDAVVVGAGPAGSVTARGLARRGLAVLLVDKATFPRPKVCGCSLNAAALTGLGAVGLGHVPAACGA
ncbi:MAG: FAD-dependent oxidoreductase, partial [Gemmataceae bacterium]|nr:FAD-dependent oxidoreductase [Gemmataceae bacterium]